MGASSRLRASISNGQKTPAANPNVHECPRDTEHARHGKGSRHLAKLLLKLRHFEPSPFTAGEHYRFQGMTTAAPLQVPRLKQTLLSQRSAGLIPPTSKRWMEVKRTALTALPSSTSPPQKVGCDDRFNAVQEHLDYLQLDPENRQSCSGPAQGLRPRLRKQQVHQR